MSLWQLERNKEKSFLLHTFWRSLISPHPPTHAPIRGKGREVRLSVVELLTILCFSEPVYPNLIESLYQGQFLMDQEMAHLLFNKMMEGIDQGKYGHLDQDYLPRLTMRYKAFRSPHRAQPSCPGPATGYCDYFPVRHRSTF